MTELLPTGLDVLVKEGQQNHIITFCKDIDQMLNGGISLNKLTEFCGVPGIGKTQLGFQLAVNTCIPEIFDGVQGKTIYIDTEGNFSLDRIKEIAGHLCAHLKEINAIGKMTSQDDPLTVEKVLDSIYYYRVYHYVELIALVNVLPMFLERDGKDVKLILLDSIAYPFRRDFPDMFVRTRSLLPMAQNLANIAEKFNLAVVMMNQVTTKITNNNANSGSKDSILIPSLGESWAHICTYRMILFYKEKYRYCHLYKSPSSKSIYHPFLINEYGIRGYSDQESIDDQNTETE